MQYKYWEKKLFTVICPEFFKCRVYAVRGTFLTLKFCLGNGQALLETMRLDCCVSAGWNGGVSIFTASFTAVSTKMRNKYVNA